LRSAIRGIAGGSRRRKRNRGGTNARRIATGRIELTTWAGVN